MNGFFGGVVLLQVEFEQFKNALILVLSSNVEEQRNEEETSNEGKLFSPECVLPVQC